MSLTIHSPATIADAAEAAGSLPFMVWAAIRAQIAHGESYAMRDGAGRAVVVGGYYPAADGAGEAWMIVAPDASKHALQLVRVVRLTAAASAYAPIRTFVETEAGRRIVMLAGFTRDTISDLEIWQWRNRQCPSSASAETLPSKPKRRPQPLAAASLPSSPDSRRSSTSRARPAESAIAAERS